MKKIKLLTSLVATVTPLTVLTPILTSCACGSEETPVAPKVNDIFVAQGPDKIHYLQHERLNLDGLIIKKVMSDGSFDRLYKNEYTTSIEDGQELTEAGNIKITVTSKKGQKSTTFTINVTERATADFVLIRTSQGYCIDGLNNSAREEIREIVVPETINGIPVVEISKGAFKGCINLESITLPFIGHTKDATATSALFGYCFGDEMYEGCGAYTWQEYSTSNEYDETKTEIIQYAIPQSLRKVTITNAESVKPGAFSNCRYLTNIEIKETNNEIEELGNYAFYNCRKLKSFTFPSSLKTIGRKCFEGCYSIKNISIPSNVETIRHNAFANCISAIGASIPESVINMGKLVFENFISGLIMVADEEVKASWDKEWVTNDISVVYGYKEGEGGGIYYTDIAQIAICGSEGNKYAYLISWLAETTGTVTIPGTVTCGGVEYPIKKVGPNVFYEEDAIEEVVLSEGIESIGGSCFEGCTALTTITFPSTLKSIGSSCFYRCNNLHQHRVNDDIVEGLNFNKVVSIGASAFEGNTALTKVDFGSALETIGDSAFKECSYLTPARDAESKKHELIFPKTIKSIGDYAFYKIAKQRDNSQTKEDADIVFEAGNTNEVAIGNYAFSDSSVRSKTGDYPDIIQIHLNFNNIKVKTISSYAFNNVYLRSIFNFPQTVETIGDYAFYYCIPYYFIENDTTQASREFVIPSSVKTIGDYAFYNWCYCKMTFDNAASLQSIGNYSFRYCQYSNNIDLTLPNSVETIGTGAFLNNSYLRTLKLPVNDKFTRLESSVFNGCTRLGIDQTDASNAIIVPANVTYLNSYAFANCTNLKFITIKGNITTVGSYCFQNCVNIEHGKDTGSGALQSLVFEDNLENCTSFGSGVYQGCTRLVWAPFPADASKESITSIPSYCFDKCEQLTDFEVTGSITTIGEAAFRFCRRMKNVTGMTAVKYIGRNAFNECLQLESIALPKACHTILDNAFANCSELGLDTAPVADRFIIPSGIVAPYSTETNKGMGNTPFVGWKDSQTIYIYEASIDSEDPTTKVITTKWGWQLEPDDPSNVSYYTCTASGSSSVKFKVVERA